jgi:hypothetical protein
MPRRKRPAIPAIGPSVDASATASVLPRRLRAAWKGQADSLPRRHGSLRRRVVRQTRCDRIAAWQAVAAYDGEQQHEASGMRAGIESTLARGTALSTIAASAVTTTPALSVANPARTECEQ